MHASLSPKKDRPNDPHHGPPGGRKVLQAQHVTVELLRGGAVLIAVVLHDNAPPPVHQVSTADEPPGSVPYIDVDLGFR